MINESIPNPKSAPDALTFHCSMCGECCSSWNLPIEADKAERLLEKPWVQERLSLTRRELQKASSAFYRLPLTDENVCVFLGEDKRCLIEVHEGLVLKPIECQRFPFAVVTAPTGEAVHDTSAACKLIAEKLLLAFVPIEPKDTVILPDEPEVLPEAVKLDGRNAWTWLQYQDWLAQARALLLTENLPWTEALLRIFGLLSPKRQPVKTKFSDGAVDGLLIFFLRKPYQTYTWLGLWRGSTYEDPRVFGVPVILSEVARVGWPAGVSGATQGLKAFLYNLISRKVLLARGGSVKQVLTLAAVAGLLVQWYARVLAAFQGRDQVDENDVSAAIRLVERYYTGHQPRFLSFFSEPFRSTLCQWLLYGVI